MKLTKRFYSVVNKAALLGVDLALHSMCSVAHFLDEGIVAFEEVGEHIENKLKQFDRKEK